MDLEKLNSYIENMSLSKEEARDLFKPFYEKRYGGPEYDRDINDPFYLNKFIEVQNLLREERKKYSDNISFYFEMAKKFAQAYIPIMIQEFGITDEKLISQLQNIMSGNNIKVFANTNEANNWIQEMSNGKENELKGGYDAFKKFNCICFIPDIGTEETYISEEQSVINATHLLSTMIHETFHLLINVMKDTHFVYDGESKLTSHGYILNEGIVEMHALDFAKKHNFIHLPAFDYFNNVEIARELKNIIGTEEFERLSLNGKYDEMIPAELLEQYQFNEKIRYFKDKGIDVDPEKIDISNNKTI